MKQILTHKIDDKFSQLKAELIKLQNVIVLFSGGVDSSFLLYFANQTLGKENVLALIGDSVSLPRSELVEAEKFCEINDITLTKLKTNELENPDYIKNDYNRCYFCKTELQKAVYNFLKSNPKFQNWKIIDGLQSDDNVNDRPGYKATNEFGILHPMYDLNIKKEEIREYLKFLNLSIYNKPESACLSSRIMKGSEVTKELLTIVENAEKILRFHNLEGARARLHTLQNNQILMRIEVKNLSKCSHLFENKEFIYQLLGAGVDYVTLDMQGYKQGGFSSNQLRVL